MTTLQFHRSKMLFVETHLSGSLSDCKCRRGFAAFFSGLFSEHTCAALIGPWHRIGGMEQILTPSEPDKSHPLPALVLFHSPLHLLSCRLICHYLFLSHSLSSPFCGCLSFHSLCLPVCQSLSRLYSRLLGPSALLGRDSLPRQQPSQM